MFSGHAVRTQYLYLLSGHVLSNFSILSDAKHKLLEGMLVGFYSKIQFLNIYVTKFYFTGHTAVTVSTFNCE